MCADVSADPPFSLAHTAVIATSGNSAGFFIVEKYRKKKNTIAVAMVFFFLVHLQGFEPGTH